MLDILTKIDILTKTLGLLEKLFGLTEKNRDKKRLKFKIMIQDIFVDVEKIVTDYLRILSESKKRLTNSECPIDAIDELENFLRSSKNDLYTSREKIRGFLSTDFYSYNKDLSDFVAGIQQIMYAGIECTNYEDRYYSIVDLQSGSGHTILALLSNIREYKYTGRLNEKFPYRNKYIRDINNTLDYFITQICKGWNLACKSYALLLVDFEEYDGLH